VLHVGWSAVVLIGSSWIACINEQTPPKGTTHNFISNSASTTAASNAKIHHASRQSTGILWNAHSSSHRPRILLGHPG